MVPPVSAAAREVADAVRTTRKFGEQATDQTELWSASRRRAAQRPSPSWIPAGHTDAVRPTGQRSAALGLAQESAAGFFAHQARGLNSATWLSRQACKIEGSHAAAQQAEQWQLHRVKERRLARVPRRPRHCVPCPAAEPPHPPRRPQPQLAKRRRRRGCGGGAVGIACGHRRDGEDSGRGSVSGRGGSIGRSELAFCRSNLPQKNVTSRPRPPPQFTEPRAARRPDIEASHYRNHPALSRLAARASTAAEVGHILGGTAASHSSPGTADGMASS